MFETSREREGYDGKRATGGRLYVYWWFEAWGSGSRAEWTTRDQAGRPPTPEELATADYIVFGFKKGGRVSYKTRTGGLDVVQRRRRAKR
jgi:hypothetical protein